MSIRWRRYIILSVLGYKYLGHPCISVVYFFRPTNTLVAIYVHDLDRIEFNRTVFSLHIFAYFNQNAYD